MRRAWEAGVTTDWKDIHHLLTVRNSIRRTYQQTKVNTIRSIPTVTRTATMAMVSVSTDSSSHWLCKGWYSASWTKGMSRGKRPALSMTERSLCAKPKREGHERCLICQNQHGWSGRILEKGPLSSTTRRETHEDIESHGPMSLAHSPHTPASGVLVCATAQSHSVLQSPWSLAWSSCDRLTNSTPANSRLTHLISARVICNAAVPLWG